MGDGEEWLPEEEDGGLLFLPLDVHGYVHAAHSSHIYLGRNNILVQLIHILTVLTACEEINYLLSSLLNIAGAGADLFYRLRPKSLLR